MQSESAIKSSQRHNLILHHLSVSKFLLEKTHHLLVSIGRGSSWMKVTKLQETASWSECVIALVSATEPETMMFLTSVCSSEASRGTSFLVRPRRI